MLTCNAVWSASCSTSSTNCIEKSCNYLYFEISVVAADNPSAVTDSISAVKAGCANSYHLMQNSGIAADSPSLEEQ